MSRLDGASLVETVTSAVNGIVHPFPLEWKIPSEAEGNKKSKEMAKKVGLKVGFFVSVNETQNHKIVTKKRRNHNI